MAELKNSSRSYEDELARKEKQMASFKTKNDYTTKFSTQMTAANPGTAREGYIKVL
jgi:hypothetical protein